MPQSLNDSRFKAASKKNLIIDINQHTNACIMLIPGYLSFIICFFSFVIFYVGMTKISGPQRMLQRQTRSNNNNDQRASHSYTWRTRGPAQFNSFYRSLFDLLVSHRSRRFRRQVSQYLVTRSLTQSESVGESHTHTGARACMYCRVGCLGGFTNKSDC